MNIKLVANYVGHILRLEGVLMLPPLLIALVMGERECVRGFAFTIILVSFAGILCSRIKPETKQIYAREGFAIVAFSWFFMSLFGALPFYFSGEIHDFVNCLFESVSGFSTTGASILTQVEGLSMSILYWRSFLCWLGGMGILVFVLAFMPSYQEGGSSFRILRAESPGPVVGKLAPKMRRTARILYIIYISLTLLEIILLLLGGMPFFDSINHAMSVAGTGGFSIRNASIAAYDSAYLQNVIGVFMVVFGINFNIFYMLLLRDFVSVYKNEELRAYMGVVACASVAIAVNIYSIYQHPLTALRYSFFQVASVMSTTGLSTADFNVWPEFSRCMLMFLMLMGACGGSTAGGMKISRVLILIKSFRASVQRLFHPRSVKIVKMDGEAIDSGIIGEVNVYMTAYIVILVVSILIVSIDNFSLETTITAVISCLNNIGPGLGDVGPAGNFSAFSPFSKLVLSMNMLLGRLEIFPLLLMFAPTAWRRSR